MNITQLIRFTTVPNLKFLIMLQHAPCATVNLQLTATERELNSLHKRATITDPKLLGPNVWNERQCSIKSIIHSTMLQLLPVLLAMAVVSINNECVEIFRLFFKNSPNVPNYLRKYILVNSYTIISYKSKYKNIYNINYCVDYY